jgi:carbamoyltransferase
MKLFSVALNMHDHNTYNGKTHLQVERHTRRKHNLNTDPHDGKPSREFFEQYVKTEDETLCFTVSNLGQEFVIDLIEEKFGTKEFLDFKPTNLWDYYQGQDFYYIDHHQSHAAYAFLSSKYEQSDILAIDGKGWKFNCVFIDKHGHIHDLSDKLSIGGLWNRLSQDLGFGYLGAGKVMGLAGYGQYDYQIHALIDYYMNNDFTLPEWSKKVLDKHLKEDVAYTLQWVTEDLIKKYVYPLKTCDNLCVAGGVAYNGYVNEMFTKHYTNVHIPPAVGDEGQALGTYMHADYVLNKNIHLPKTASGKHFDYVLSDNFIDLDIKKVAQDIANGKIVGWFQGLSESGNRALGNRSILADPRNPNIKNIINTTIKKREDFRPFAPSVLEEYYQEYFDTNQPSPYMSRIMPVKSDKIPGVTHVDNTARIQTVNQTQNEKFYDLINEFYKITGIPMLLNTSFNCQEPIVENPYEAYETYEETAIDILVIGNKMVSK